MKNYDEMIKKLQEEQARAKQVREDDKENVTNAINWLANLSGDARKELAPAIKRLHMFLNGERFTRSKK